MRIIWKGNVFNPTGLATANREMVKSLTNAGAKVQCTDVWNSKFEFNEGLENLNSAVDGNSEGIITVFADYPQYWTSGQGKLIGHFLHEGTKIWPYWAPYMNTVEKIWVPSNATKKLFLFNGVNVPMEVIPYGTNPQIYKPTERQQNDDFVFLSVNSWGGGINDRKGTDVLIKAFDEEFKETEKVRLCLKIGTFWQAPVDYNMCIFNILGKNNKNIMFNSDYVKETELAEYYRNADCFVAPTRGEAFGLTILNAMSSGLPVIVTRDNNSGHMDFCRNKDSVLFIEPKEMVQADPRFFVEGNLQPLIDKESLKKQMRYMFDNKDKFKKLAVQNSEDIRTNWTWQKTGEKLIDFFLK